MEPMIEISNCTKYYGEKAVLKDISFTVEPGEIFGLSGPNASGKTCLLKMAAGLIKPSAGEVRIGGYSLPKDRRKVSRIMGYMPDDPGIYPDMLVNDYIDYFASCQGLKKNDRPGIIQNLLDLMELLPYRQEKLNGLSRSFLQRVNFARLMVHDPQVLILDEPAAGMDEAGRLAVMDMLVEMAKMGKTILIAGHSIAGLSKICRRIGRLDAGELTIDGKTQTYHQPDAPYQQSKLKIKIIEGRENAMKVLQKIPVIRDIRVEEEPSTGYIWMEMDFSGDELIQSQVLGYLAKFGVPVVEFKKE